MYPMSYGSPYGPSMADSEGGNAFGLHPFAFRHPMLGGALPPQAMPMRTGGGLPPMGYPQAQTGGPMMPQQNPMPSNILAGGGLPPQMAMQVGTGGPGQMQMPQNRLAFGGGYNHGLGGLLR